MNHRATTWSPVDDVDLRQAHARLEGHSFAHRLSTGIGTPIEKGLKLLPRPWHRAMQRSAEKAAWRALECAAWGLERKERGLADFGYRLAGIAAGAAGGFFGGAAVMVESALTTLVMLRSIADIARAEGERLDDPRSRLACLEVFALGGRRSPGDVADLGYFGLRFALEAPVSGAARFIAEHGVAGAAGAAGSPPLVEFMAVVSRRLGVTLSEKAAATIVPFIGAAGGAFVNGVFIQHFQDVARGHFTIRRLERKFGHRDVQEKYHQLSQASAPLLVYPLAA
ncbi:MAG: EcsC family protein [Gammaproteobacteria bacterium]|nr:EcsC family protein [Gammaproteobacteria bacterium]